MRKHPILVAGAALVVALALSWCLSPKLRAQVSGLVPASFNGGEVWQVALQGPGGSSEYVTTGMLRNTTGVTTTATTTGTIPWPGTNPSQGAQFSTIVWTAASVSATINLPANPFDGQIVSFSNGSGSAFTQLTVATTDGSTLHLNITGALADGASAEWLYVKSTNTWYKQR